MGERARTGALLLAVAATAGWGWLHTELKASDPEADSVLEASPAAVTLTYTTVVQLALSNIKVQSAGADGEAAAAGELAYLADDRREVLVLPLTEPLGSGSYTVAWTTAGPDGHAPSGEFGFRVELPVLAMEEVPGAAAGAENAETAPGDDVAGKGVQAGAGESGAGFDLVRTGMCGSFSTWAIVALLGAVAFRLLVLGQCARAGESGAVIDAATRRVRTLGVLGLGLLLATLPFRLWHQTEAFFPGDVASNLFTVATGTVWGAGWWLQFVLGVLIGGGVRVARRAGAGNSGWAVMTLGALLLPIVPLLSGHGWTDSPRALSAAATYLHVAAAGGWVGGLACLLLAGLPALHQHGGQEGIRTRPDSAAMVGAFSRVAQVAVALLLVTGADQGLDPHRIPLRPVDHGVGKVACSPRMRSWPGSWRSASTTGASSAPRSLTVPGRGSSGARPWSNCCSARPRSALPPTWWPSR